MLIYPFSVRRVLKKEKLVVKGRNNSSSFGFCRIT